MHAIAIAFDPLGGDLTCQWMGRACEAITPHADAATANIIDAVQEGLSLHRWFLPDDITEEVVRHTITTLMPSPPAQQHR